MKIKNLKVRKNILSLIVGGTLLLSGLGEAKANNIDGYVIANDRVNVRIDDSVDSKKLGRLEENDIAELIYSDPEWNCIKYGDMIGYVHNDYVTVNGMNAFNGMKHEDILKLTDTVNLRVGPGTEYKKIGKISENTEVKSYQVTDNGWYLVSNGNQIGYICGDYVNSLLDNINNLYPDLFLNEINIEKIVYATKNIEIKSFNDNIENGNLSKYEACQVLGEFKDNYLIRTSNKIGFIDKENTKELKDEFVIVDISDQKVYLYDDSTLILSSSVTTGKDSTPTDLGIFSIRYKERNRYLVGPGYRSFVKYWMPYNGGEGLHDASWRSSFGGERYHKNGSHGCVNLPENIAEQIYNYVDKGTKVLVQK